MIIKSFLYTFSLKLFLKVLSKTLRCKKKTCAKRKISGKKELKGGFIYNKKHKAK